MIKVKLKLLISTPLSQIMATTQVNQDHGCVTHDKGEPKRRPKLPPQIAKYHRKNRKDNQSALHETIFETVAKNKARP